MDWTNVIKLRTTSASVAAAEETHSVLMMHSTIILSLIATGKKSYCMERSNMQRSECQERPVLRYAHEPERGPKLVFWQW